jgi:hypothetical protein
MKPGWQTTEFWATIGSTLWGIASTFIPAVSPLHAFVPVIATGVYTIARTLVKATAAAPSSPAAGPMQHMGGMP